MMDFVPHGLLIACGYNAETTCFDCSTNSVLLFAFLVSDAETETAQNFINGIAQMDQMFDTTVTAHYPKLTSFFEKSNDVLANTFGDVYQSPSPYQWLAGGNKRTFA